MAQTAAQRKRAQRAGDRARLGDEEYKRIERDKMRAYRASKRPPKPTITINIKDTIKFMDKLKSRYPNKNSLKNNHRRLNQVKKSKKSQGTSTTKKSTSNSCKRLCTII